jgi:serine kinase of HPr protein (carbohydrate metabolism regulator)
MSGVNEHASCVVVSGCGVLITGPSGAGKSSLALALVSHCNAIGRFARIVCDDRTDLFSLGERLVGRAPAAIAGLAEARGFAPSAIPTEHSAVLDIVVNLGPAADAARFNEGRSTTILGVSLPLLLLPQADPVTAVYAVAAALSLPPFAAETASN